MSASVAAVPRLARSASTAPPAVDAVLSTNPSPAAWDEFARHTPEAGLYHLWGWRRVIEDTFGHETIYLSATHAGAIVGILPLAIFRSRIFGNFAVSLPFVDEGGICTTDEGVRRLLADCAASVAASRHLSHVELRHVARQRPELPVRQHKVGMTLRLVPDLGKAWTLLDRKVRNQVRKAEKSGLTERRGGLELLDAFYDVFCRNMRDLGTPVYPRHFFERIISTFADSSTVFVVEDQQRTPVAAAIGLVHRDSFAVPWASSLREFRAHSPNTLLYWRMIEHAIASGLTTFNFGRSTPGEGTYQFKEQWGARPTPQHWEYVLESGRPLPDLTPKNPKFRAAIAAWKRLPVPVTRWIGPHIIRSIP
jgi:FemAB-related protein (PEP-CTERM system-associated)